MLHGNIAQKVALCITTLCYSPYDLRGVHEYVVIFFFYYVKKKHGDYIERTKVSMHRRRLLQHYAFHYSAHDFLHRKFPCFLLTLSVLQIIIIHSCLLILMIVNYRGFA